MTGVVLNGARQMTLGVWAAPRACASGGSSCAASVASVLFRRSSAARGTGTSPLHHAPEMRTQVSLDKTHF